jgi:hypothetical protein
MTIQIVTGTQETWKTNDVKFIWNSEIMWSCWYELSFFPHLPFFTHHHDESFMPPIVGKDKSDHGHHKWTARAICPLSKLEEFDENPAWVSRLFFYSLTDRIYLDNSWNLSVPVREKMDTRWKQLVYPPPFTPMGRCTTCPIPVFFFLIDFRDSY